MEAGAGVTTTVVLPDGSVIPATVSFTLPVWPVSVNKLYQQKYNRATGKLEFGPSNEHILWRTKMGKYVPPRSRFKIADTSSVHVDCVFHFPFKYRTTGNTRKLDPANYLKAVYDLVSRKLGFDDLLIRSGTFTSVDSDVKEVRVVVTEVVTPWQPR